MLTNDLTIVMDTQPTPQQKFSERFNHFLTKTDTQYTHTGLDYLTNRGIENRLLENLLEFLPDGAIIAGGFALSVINDDRNARDIDFFFTSVEAFNKTFNLFIEPEDGMWAYEGYTLKSDLSPDTQSRYVSFTHPTRPGIQLLKMVWYDSPDHVIDSFDFTIVQFAFTNKEFVFNGVSMMDVARKRLVPHRMQFPASTLRRLIKYASKGYYACPGSLVSICESIQKFSGQPDINDVVYVD